MTVDSSTSPATFVLDTNVLLADPDALHRFDEHDVVVPLVVIEELDGKKTRHDEIGRNARTALRLIEEVRARSSSGAAKNRAAGTRNAAPTAAMPAVNRAPAWPSRPGTRPAARSATEAARTSPASWRSPPSAGSIRKPAPR